MYLFEVCYSSTESIFSQIDIIEKIFGALRYVSRRLTIFLHDKNAKSRFLQFETLFRTKKWLEIYYKIHAIYYNVRASNRHKNVILLKNKDIISWMALYNVVCKKLNPPFPEIFRNSVVLFYKKNYGVREKMVTTVEFLVKFTIVYVSSKIFYVKITAFGNDLLELDLDQNIILFW